MGERPLPRALQGLRGRLNPRLVRRVAIAAVAVASAALVAVAVYRNWDALRSYPWRLDARMAIAALLLYPIAAGIPALVWGGILRQLGAHHDYRQDVRIFFTTSLARRLPTPLWFLAGRTYLCHEIGVPMATTYLATAIESVLLFLAALAVLQSSLVLASDLVLLRPYRPALAVLTAVVVACIASPRLLHRGVDWVVRRLARRLTGGTSIAWHIGRRHLALWTAWYAVAWLLGGVILFLLLAAVHPLALRRLPGTVAIWAASGVLGHIAALTIGGIGAKEISMAALLATMVPAPLAIAAPILLRLWCYVNDLLWFGVASWWARRDAPSGAPKGGSPPSAG
ncbi:MAG TPA: hypothetical protein GX714_07980 [Chloroflexi bacterium]|jgi:hypothetical protein|nr:hypothetical protein [Chloroflexota bacterium]